MKRKVLSYAALAIAVFISVQITCHAYSQYAWDCTLREMNDSMQQTEAKTLSLAKSNRSVLEDALKQTQELLDSISNDQVSDPNTITSLKAFCTEAEELLMCELADIPESDDPLQESHDLEQSVLNNSSMSEAYKKTAVEITDAIESVNASAAEKVRQETDVAREELKATLSKASEALSASEGKVADATVREELSDGIDEATSLLESGSKDELLAIRDTIVGLQETVNESVKTAEEEKAAADARAAEEEAKSAQAAQASEQQQSTDATSQTSSGAVQQDIWYVSYTNAYDTSTAAADGSVTQWEEGYFIAHEWSENGQMILSKPAYVVVDGTTYKFVSSMTVSYDTYWEEIEGYVHANGGIGFQTCVSGGYLVTHYEPA